MVTPNTRFDAGGSRAANPPKRTLAPSAAPDYRRLMKPEHHDTLTDAELWLYTLTAHCDVSMATTMMLAIDCGWTLDEYRAVSNSLCGKLGR